MQRLIITCGTLGSGGAERVLTVLAPYFADAFDEVIMILWKEGSTFYTIDPRIRIVSVHQMLKHPNLLAKTIWVRRYIRQQHPTLILSFLTSINMLTLTATLGLGCTTVVSERDDPSFIRGGRIMGMIRDLLYRTAAGVICQTETIRRQFGGSLKEKTHIIFNPLFLKQEMTGKALQTPKSRKIVSVGRLHPQKNHQLLLEAFARFRRTHPDHTLYIYGKGNERPVLESYIREHGLRQHVFLPGAIPDVLMQLLDAEAFVMTSRHEGMSNALIEAMAVGMPCISTKVSGAVDLIVHGENGLLCDPDSDQLAQALAAVTDRPEYAARLGAEASKIAERLEQSRIAAEWIQYLKARMPALSRNDSSTRV